MRIFRKYQPNFWTVKRPLANVKRNALFQNHLPVFSFRFWRRQKTTIDDFMHNSIRQSEKTTKLTIMVDDIRRRWKRSWRLIRKKSSLFYSLVAVYVLVSVTRASRIKFTNDIRRPEEFCKTEFIRTSSPNYQQLVE